MVIEETHLIIVFEIKSVGIFLKAKLYCHDMMPGKFWPKPAIYYSVAMAILQNIKIYIIFFIKTLPVSKTKIHYHI